MAYNPGKFPENYKPLDQVDDSQVNKSLWVHMFAGLRNPSITYGNHLKQLFLDDEIPSLVANFFPDADKVPPQSLWTNNLQKFAFGNENHADM